MLKIVYLSWAVLNL